MHQYSETNVIYFLFNVLRIKGFYMFQALLVHLQEAFHKRHLVYCVRFMSVVATRIGVEIRSSPILVSQRPQWPRGLRRRSTAARLQDIVGSNSTGSMDVCLLCLLCVVR
jgi:hypothetical protein